MAQAAGGVPLAGESQPSRNPYREHRGLLSAQEVRDLSRLRWAPPLRDTAIAWVQILAAWVAVALWPQWWVILLALPAVGTASYALHILGHDAMHRRYLPNPRWNDLAADLLLYGPVAAVTHVIGRNHLLHHLYLATDADPDRHKYSSSEKRTKLALILYLSGVSNLLPVVRNVLLRRASDVKEVPEVTESAASREGSGVGYTRRDAAIAVGWQVLLVAGLSSAIGWWAYPALWLVPVYIFRYCADEARQFLEHAHPEPDEIADSHRLITYTSSRLERLFFAPLNMNLHTAHHLWPSVPYYNLPAADRLIRERNRSPELVWRNSYLGSLREYFRSLPLAAKPETAS